MLVSSPQSLTRRAGELPGLHLTPRAAASASSRLDVLLWHDPLLRISVVFGQVSPSVFPQSANSEKAQARAC